ncbi:MEMO1 family protein [Candidatus Micrarchaeota archaeon]|nr:MEMO1 family protein [Candidatus Micrarchaeota archaeon]
MRKPAVAGAFYPRRKEDIEKMLDEFERKVEARIKKEKIPPPKKIYSCVSPHAGYVYSGFTAMHSFKFLSECLRGKKNLLFVIVSPNHTGYGLPVSISTQDWETPVGVAEVDVEFANKILEQSSFAEKDEEAHLFEHSIEVQLPFLQHFFKEFSFVPITLMKQDYGVARDLAEAIIKTEKETKKDVLVIASSDFTHYELAEEAKRKDFYAIEAAEALDAKEFLRRVSEKHASVCGFGAVATAIEYAKKKNARKGILMHFSDSGEITGEREVVDYASIVFV